MVKLKFVQFLVVVVTFEYPQQIVNGMFAYPRILHFACLLLWLIVDCIWLISLVCKHNPRKLSSPPPSFSQSQMPKLLFLDTTISTFDIVASQIPPRHNPVFSRIDNIHTPFIVMCVVKNLAVYACDMEWHKLQCICGDREKDGRLMRPINDDDDVRTLLRWHGVAASSICRGAPWNL